MQKIKGIIMKSTAGFYYVRSDDGKITECKGRTKDEFGEKYYKMDVVRISRL